MMLADLFVNIGVKGGPATVNTLGSVRKGLGETASMGWEAKAALVGAFYALERLFSASGKRGAELSNFNAVLGVSAQTLQRYQWAAQQVNVSNEEVAGSFKGLQSTITKMLMGEGAPKGLARMLQLTMKEFGEFDALAAQKNPEKLLQRLQAYAGKETNAGFRNEVLKSFGISEGMVAALTRKAFTPAQLAKAPVYSDGQIAALDKANAAWRNLGTKIEMEVGAFNAKHGPKLVGELTTIVDKIFDVAKAFEKLADKAKLFEGLTTIFQGWKIIFDGLAVSID